MTRKAERSLLCGPPPQVRSAEAVFLAILVPARFRPFVVEIEALPVRFVTVLTVL